MSYKPPMVNNDSPKLQKGSYFTSAESPQDSI